MDVGIRIDADEVGSQNSPDGGYTWATEFEGLSVSMAGEARCNGDEIGGAEYRCADCGDTLREAYEGDGYESADDGSAGCPARQGEDDEAHQARPIAGSFANSARVVVSDDDAVTVTISVGDPRGAFAMTVYRRDDGSLVLSVPHPSNGFPHMKLTEINAGTYAVS